MARLSDIIEDFLKVLLEESNGELEIQRNELADYFECAPSQINYVLATRFSLDRGYYIESRRGGGGYIRIIHLDIEDDDYILDLITNRIGAKLSQQEAYNIIDRMEEKEIVTPREAVLMKYALQDKAIALPSSLKDNIRAGILKSMLTAILAFQSSDNE
ncbi:MAG: CtsR family transcriptional regulator [Xylanivirga thermophila]|jgi:transcriptional regulator of stress and heat shock response|uniref:CtsR family transcriptional regulator n=1 Tax=Xylanivirga thermophila TaxID=2496273 RepID=UPI0039F5121C